MQSLLKPYRGPSYRYKIKKVTTNNKTGDSFAITVPKVVAEMFINVEFNLFIAGRSMVFASGCKMENKDMKYTGEIFPLV
ncbi:MAG: hypothetical protein AABY22_30800 [Nanoarchaeota archaeon]